MELTKEQTAEEKLREEIRKLQHLQFLVIRAHVEGFTSDDENRCYGDYITDRFLAFIVPKDKPPNDDDRIYPCDGCGKLRSKNEGGTTFTVCDACWDRLHPNSKR